MSRFFLSPPSQGGVGEGGSGPPAPLSNASAPLPTREGIRDGFTLLEVLMALAISVLLMAALYVSMDVLLRYAQAGRERVDEAVLARALLQRIRSDVSSAITPIQGSATSTSSAGPTPATGTAAATTTTDTPTVSLDAVTPFNAGIQGEIDRLTMWVTRVPGQNRPGTEADTPNGGPDVHRVTYWLAGDKGLASQDISRVTADDSSIPLPPDVSDDAITIVAPEVTSLEFHYFDGTAWQDSWDGTAMSADGSTPLGPPKAVKVIIGIKAPNGKAKTYEHVIAIQTANAQPSGSTTEEMQ
ncbi:MAG: prepilin-type N-terminal cleavage/methylation domain-containing protein [Gemmataceae bacterium]